MEFELHLVGRVNPHFGKPIVRRIQALRRTRGGSLYFHEAASDDVVAELYQTVRASVFPTRAEGCGLPLLESLWMGVPCVCSDLPVLRENAGGGGCLPLALDNSAAWKTGLRRVLTDTIRLGELTAQATTRALPNWKDAAQTLASALV
jgi:glycosyltransferase involved in cell wall biosynthesis